MGELVTGEISLREAVAALRDELLGAVRAAATDELAFVVGPVEMEFTVELTRATGTDGKLAISIASVGANKGTTQAHTQRVCVTLTPTTPEGRDLLISAPVTHATHGPGDVSQHLPD
ncbi:hypothetical protein GCM10009801_44900 [Streptomyces albiaxialis]|uniref:Trypsin-co-occurring domain-containing protein n=1 Tax=Streptomyces albiaxialis TaxID=329523 RepID=A0ABP5HPY5_9ACTN